MDIGDTVPEIQTVTGLQVKSMTKEIEEGKTEGLYKSYVKDEQGLPIQDIQSHDVFSITCDYNLAICVFRRCSTES